MGTAREVLEHFKRSGIAMQIQDGRLRVGPRNSLTEQDLAMVRTYRDEIIRVLQDEQQAEVTAHGAEVSGNRFNRSSSMEAAGGRKEDTHLIHCALCSCYKEMTNGDRKYGLGQCTSRPWDGHRGQWPQKRHLCSGFRPRVTH